VTHAPSHYLTREAAEARLTKLRDRIAAEALKTNLGPWWPPSSDYHRLPLSERVEIRRAAMTPGGDR
jgi:hypothetical protein